MKATELLEIKFSSPIGEEALLQITGSNVSPLFLIDDQDALAHNEAVHQIVEGCTYDFELPEGYYFFEAGAIIRPLARKLHLGRIHPNISVGTLTLDLKHRDFPTWGNSIRLEVQSVKTDYRSDYQVMLNEIAEKCTDLIMRQGSAVSQSFDVSHELDSKTAYQRFAFLKSLLDSEEFRAAVHKVQSSPITKWKALEVEKDIRAVRKIDSRSMRQFASAKHRISLPEEHPLKQNSNIDSVPAKLFTGVKHETVDTPENRFIKYALESFLFLCGYIKAQAKDNRRLNLEATQAEDDLQAYLEHALFREVGRIQSVPLNSPVLQRKEGYREILKAWLVSDLAAKLTWEGGEDVYRGGKRDVATLYEYWLFFKLLEVIGRVFHVEPAAVEDLIELTNDRLGLKLKQGNRSKNVPPPINGVYKKGSRNLQVKFAYNRTFGGNGKLGKAGSWTQGLRPDYTLSIWPAEIKEELAEKEELIVHIHFDAKYKVENFVDMLGKFETSTENEDADADSQDAVEREEREGIYKRADLLKMHTYRDAIRRTAGAYVVYPGDKEVVRSGFHEIIPGLGAFAINPKKANDGAKALEDFLGEVLKHFLNRASQRERMAFYNYEVHKEENQWEVNEPLPEPYGANRGHLPVETMVLIGYYKSQAHLEWILSIRKYNWRAISDDDVLLLDQRHASARYLLLYNANRPQASRLFSLKSGKVQMMSKQQLKAMGYPKPKRNRYIVQELGDAADPILGNGELNFASLGTRAFVPFTMSMAELLTKLRSEKGN